MMMSYRKAFLFLLLLVFLKAIFMAFFILHGEVGLGPDEAQYWTWSQHLDWGYYSKPPGIAWLIWIGCKLFGSNELGVRSVALLFGSLIPLAVFGLAHSCHLQPRTCFWSGLTMALTPLGILSTLLAITDGGMVFFWTTACILLIGAIQRQSSLPVIGLGVVIAAGALFKWPIYFFWLIALGVAYFKPNLPPMNGSESLRPRLGEWIAGISLSCIGLLPSIVWNMQHEWATFRHVFSTVRGGEQNHLGYQGNFFSFFGEQFLLISPILGGLLLWGFFLLRRKRVERGVRTCAYISIFILGVACFFSFFLKIQGNWAVFAYPTAIVFLCAFFIEMQPRNLIFQTGVISGICLSLFALFIPLLQAHQFVHLPYAWNPFRHNMGWEKIPSTLQHVGYDPDQHFLFGDKYQTSSILSFYGKNQKRAYFFNIHGLRKNQFSFWPQLWQEQKHQTGYYVLFEHFSSLISEKKIKEIEQKLNPYFEKVTFLGIEPIFFNQGKIVKGAFIFLCENYNGGFPVDPYKY